MSFGVTDNEQAPAADLKRWMIGGVVVAVIITIIGALIGVNLVKRRKGLNYYLNVNYFFNTLNL